MNQEYHERRHEETGTSIGRALALFLVPPALLVLAASIFLGPALLLLLFPIAVIALAVEPMLRRRHLRHAVDTAAEVGVHTPFTTWGEVVSVKGVCPTGPTPHQGEEFVITEEGVQPPLCEHAHQVLLREAARLERGELLGQEPVIYQDADHRMEFDLQHENQPIQPSP